MRRLGETVLLMGCLLVSGCTGIAGKWEATGDTGDFQLASATFNKDKTYEATGEYGGQSRTSAGKYTYGWMKLTLTPDGGGEVRTYGANMSMNGKTLTVTNKDESGKKSIDMKRAGCCQDCDKKCCKKS